MVRGTKGRGRVHARITRANAAPQSAGKRPSRSVARVSYRYHTPEALMDIDSDYDQDEVKVKNHNEDDDAAEAGLSDEATGAAGVEGPASTLVGHANSHDMGVDDMPIPESLRHASNDFDFAINRLLQLPGMEAKLGRATVLSPPQIAPSNIATSSRAASPSAPLPSAPDPRTATVPVLPPPTAAPPTPAILQVGDPTPPTAAPPNASLPSRPPDAPLPAMAPPIESRPIASPSVGSLSAVPVCAVPVCAVPLSNASPPTAPASTAIPSTRPRPTASQSAAPPPTATSSSSTAPLSRASSSRVSSSRASSVIASSVIASSVIASSSTASPSNAPSSTASFTARTPPGTLERKKKSSSHRKADLKRSVPRGGYLGSPPAFMRDYVPQTAKPSPRAPAGPAAPSPRDGAAPVTTSPHRDPHPISPLGLTTTVPDNVDIADGTGSAGSATGLASPPTTPKLKGVIDHNAFPDIIRLIADFASLPSLALLRATCRRIRDEIDSESQRAAGRVVFENGKVRLASGSKNVRQRKVTTRVLDLGKLSNDDRSQFGVAWRHIWASHYAKTPDILPRVKVLRILDQQAYVVGERMSWDFRVDTTIVFCNASRLADGVVTVPLQRISRSRLMVFHIRYDPARSFRVDLKDKFVQDVEYHFLFTPTATSVPLCPLERIRLKNDRISGRVADQLLGAIFHKFGQGEPHVKFTLVGAETWPLGWCSNVDRMAGFQGEPNPMRLYCLQVVIDKLVSKGRPLPLPTRDNGLRLMSFQKMDEYVEFWKTVCDEGFDLVRRNWLWERQRR